MKNIIAIDGPAAAGKSTIAKAIALKAGYLYIDTGAMYRTIAYFALKDKVDINDHIALTKMAENIKINLEMTSGEYKVYANDEDVSVIIRTPEVGKMASPVSAVAGVRRHLVSEQQRLADQKGKVIMDGRDIASVVLPNADLKIYMTADIEKRGKRRFLELQSKNIFCDLAEVTKDIYERDRRDLTREHSPLTRCSDAILVDTTYLEIDQVVEKIWQLIGE